MLTLYTILSVFLSTTKRMLLTNEAINPIGILSERSYWQEKSAFASIQLLSIWQKPFWTTVSLILHHTSFNSKPKPIMSTKRTAV
jgi:hypothetical protein